MTKPPKPIASLTQLRQRKAELRREMEQTKQVISKSVIHFVGRQAIIASLSATLVAGTSAFLFRKIKKNETYQALNMGLTAKADGFAAWIPMIRVGLGYLLDFVEARSQQKFKAEDFDLEED